ncbi:MAG: hypothetical protein V8S27_00985 [Lachnospiraceae bacterium]
MITRYDEVGIYPFERVKPVITEILKTVIADGKGIEMDASSHRYGLKESDSVARYFELIPRTWRRDDHDRE